MWQPQCKSENKLSTGLLTAVLLLLFAGCASIPMAPPEEDRRAKTMTAPADKALIFIYRHELFGSAIKMTLTINGRSLGDTVSKSYYLVEAAPGNYTITSEAENTSTLELAVEAGKKYYVWQEVKMGALYAGSELQLVSASEGQNGVAVCKLVKILKL